MNPLDAVVTGIGAVTSLGVGVDATLHALRAGRSGRRSLAELGALLGRPLEGCPWPELDDPTVGVPRARRRYLSAAMCALHVAAREALAGAAPDAGWRADCGVALAALVGERTTRAELAALAAPHDDADAYAAALLARSPLTALRAQPGLLTGLLSEMHGLGGPCLTLLDDEGWGGAAVTEACAAIGDGWGPRWVVGGVFDLDDPWALLRSDDVLGSAAAVLVLESDAVARARGARILARLTIAESPTPVVGAPEAPCRTALGETRTAAIPLALVLAVAAGRRAVVVGPTLEAIVDRSWRRTCMEEDRVCSSS